MPRYIVLSGHLPERAAGRSRVRVGKVHLVQRIEGLKTKLQLHILSDRRVLDQRGVPGIVRIAANSAESRGKGDQVVGELLRGIPIEATGVEPLVDFVAVVAGDRDLGERARNDGVAESQRYAALIGVDGCDLPVTQQDVGQAVHVREKVSASSEREFVNAGNRDVLGIVLGGGSPGWGGVARVQESDLVQELGEGVGHLGHEAV